MKIRHVVSNRNTVRIAVLLAALGGVQVAHANDPRFNAFMGQVMGNSTTVNFGSGGQALVTSSANLGTPTLGNMGLSRAGKDVALGGNVRIPLGDTGKAVNAVAKAPITRAAFLRGLGSAVSANPLVGIGLAIAAPAIGDWLAGAGVRMNPNAADYPEKPFQLTASSDGYKDSDGAVHMNQASACAAEIAIQNGKTNQFIFRSGGSYPAGPGVCPVETYIKSNNQIYNSGGALHVAKVPDVFKEGYPASMNDIAPYMDAPEAPALTPQAVEQGVKVGIDPFGGQYPKPAVTGPSSVPGERTQTSTQTRVHPGTSTEVAPGTNTQTQPATRTTTSESEHRLVYNGNTVTYNTTNVTNTTITNNVTGDTITNNETTSRENDAKPDEPREDLCQKNPDILACSKPDLDTPDDEIPKSKFNITYGVEDEFGGGACPADLYSTVGGHQLKVWDYALTCSYVTSYVRPIVLVLAALMSLFIVAPVGAKP